MLDRFPASFNIHEETDFATLWTAMPVYNGLLRYSALRLPESPGLIEAELATDWETGQDGLSLTLALREGARWHDGQPFTAQDVRFTLGMLSTGTGLESDPRQSWFANIESVEAVTDWEVVLHLKRPQPSLPALLASGVSVMYPAHVGVVDTERFREDMVGTGPFRLAYHSAGEGVITLERNEDYFVNGRPYLDEVSFIIVPDPASRRAFMQTGYIEISLPFDLSAGDVEAIRARAPSLLVQETVSTTSRRVLFNQQREAWADPNVRRAVSLALNRHLYASAMQVGEVVAGGIIPPAGMWKLPEQNLAGLPGYGGDAQSDLVEARDLLASAGYSAGSPVSLIVPQGSLASDTEWVQARLARLDIRPEVSMLAPQEWDAAISSGSFDLALTRDMLLEDDPDAALLSYYTCSGGPERGGYCDDEVQALLERQSSEVNIGLRLKDVHLAQRRLIEDAADLVLGWEVVRVLVSPRVRGWEMNPGILDNARMQDVWIAAGMAQ